MVKKKLDLNLIVIGSLKCVNLLMYHFDENEIHFEILGRVGALSTFCPRGQGGGCKMSTLVHSRGGGGQNWSKFGPRSC